MNLVEGQQVKVTELVENSLFNRGGEWEIYDGELPRVGTFIHRYGRSQAYMVEVEEGILPASKVEVIEDTDDD